MSELTPQEYRNRIKEGQVVYFAEPNNVLGRKVPDFTLTVRKATVINAEEGRRYPAVLRWNDASSDPKGTGISVTKSPRELFTEEELKSLTVEKKEFQNRGIDNLIGDVVSNRWLAHILSETARERLGDDFKRKPNDPEY